MKAVSRIFLWSVAIGLTLIGALHLVGAFDTSGTDPAGRGLNQAYGFLMALVGVAAIATLLLARWWRGWLVIAGIIVVVPFVLGAVLSVMFSLGERRVRQEMEDMSSGRADFGNQPALLAVAEAISRNDESAIRAAAKNVSDLQAPGEDGKTLLFFAVQQALERPQLTTAVETLLSLGADPNYNNGSQHSFALAESVSGEVRLLRVMLDAGGDANGRDFKRQPIVFQNWQMTYNEAHRPQRLRLLLDRGTDVNSALSEDSPRVCGLHARAIPREHGGGAMPAHTAMRCICWSEAQISTAPRPTELRSRNC